MSARLLILCLFGLTFACLHSHADGVLDDGVVIWSELSRQARSVVPNRQVVALRLKSGESLKGYLESENSVNLKINLSSKSGVVNQRVIPVEEIGRKQYQSIEPEFESVLIKALGNRNKWTQADQFTSVIDLLNEFIALFPESRSTPGFKGQVQALLVEKRFAEEGREKVGGEWYAPVEGAAAKYRVYKDTLKKMQGQYNGINRDTYRGDPEVKKMYQRTVEAQRDTARSLPQLMQDYIPKLKAKGDYDTAIAETDAFTDFFAIEVISNEQELGNAFSGLDFSYITRIQEDLLSSYVTAGKGQETKSSGVPKDMVYVPGGFFLMGRSTAQANEPDFPMHFVYVDSYLIDKHEVSNKEYREFIESIKIKPDSSLEHPDAPLLKKHDPKGWSYKGGGLAGDDQPVVGVDWFDAYAYAQWKGKRLPTEAEWEKAARGWDTRTYVWGNDSPNNKIQNTAPGRQLLMSEVAKAQPPPPPKGGLFSCRRNQAPPPPPPGANLKEQTWPVDKFIPSEVEKDPNYVLKEEILSPYGLMHMNDNAAEWVFDYFDPDYYKNGPLKNPKGPEDKQKYHVYRGGHYLSGKDGLGVSLRWFPRNDSEAAGLDSRGRPFIGFRCAKSVGLAGN